MIEHPIYPTDADNFIQNSTPEQPIVQVALSSAHGRVLRETIYADRDYPAFNRVCMDGIAIHTDALTKGITTFKRSSTQGAGETPHTRDTLESCIEIMTGAATPSDCNAVIRYEDLIITGSTVTLAPGLSIREGQNIQPKGSDYLQGAALITQGTILNGIHIGILASVGAETVTVSKKVSITIISTGTELVPLGIQPNEYQVRLSNNHTLNAFIDSESLASATVLHVPDNKDTITEVITTALTQSEVVILTGGVSKGKFDYVPNILKNLGVSQTFHMVKQRPGKPLWFGVGPQKQMVFGLPGNPVPTIMTYHRYIAPMIRNMSSAPILSTPMMVEVGNEISFNPALQYFVPVRLIPKSDGGFTALPVFGNGSGDFYALEGSDGFIELTWEEKVFEAGYLAPFYPWITRSGSL
ncbi:MAG: molybdopterin molybdotransferase MoeA [Fibrobacterales bacterium]